MNSLTQAPRHYRPRWPVVANKPWQRAQDKPGYTGRHAIAGTLTTHVRFVELPDGDIRKIRIFA